MSGILIVAFLVHCSQSLLQCDEISTQHLAFGDIADCRGALTRIVEDQQHRLGDARVVMGKCRYQLLEPAPDRQIADLPKGRCIRHLAAVHAPQTPVAAAQMR